MLETEIERVLEEESYAFRVGCIFWTAIYSLQIFLS